MNTLPLLPEVSANTVLAYRDGAEVRQAEYFNDVMALAQRLPATRHILNLCLDRYWFSVALFAAISRDILSLLPNSSAPGHLASICAQAQDVICLGDRNSVPIGNVPCMRIDIDELGATPTTQRMPLIPFEQRIACVFTSGSTGTPQPHYKSFGRMRLSSRAAAGRVWEMVGDPCNVLGTVPVGHMFGLESTVFLPLFGGGRLSEATPFYPADVVAELSKIPEPRLLVSTPFHLRMLLDADINIPKIAGILCATAPLSLDLAKKAEERTGAPIVDIYGSTETGQMAMRRPTKDTEWRTLSGITIQEKDGVATAEGLYLENAQPLNDMVDLVSASRFKLIDRNANMINIVGKRSSLSFLNHILTSLPGVRDGVFCLPEHDQSKEVARLAVFVVAPDLSLDTILAGLRPLIDPVFLPRPIIKVNEIQRDQNGKLSAATLNMLIAEHLVHVS